MLLVKNIYILFLFFYGFKYIEITNISEGLNINSSKLVVVHNSIDIHKYYSAFSGGSLVKINEMIIFLEKEKASSVVNAYKGALLMKKASLIDIPAKKLKLFKGGRLLLESEIKNNPQNIEYRFLRLSIQEHAPKFLKYNKTILYDKNLVVKGYKKINKVLQKIIKEYSKSSGILKEYELIS
ncbi:MAG: hypothetical protein ABFS35_05745 [Bacteroidota bacterium]